MRLLVLLAIAAALLAAPSSTGAWQGPPDPYRFDRAAGRCLGGLQPGAEALVRWLRATTGNNRFVPRPGEPPPGYRCDSAPGSTHSEGRSVDWALDANVEADRRQGALIKGTLLKNGHALARRMGVQTILWRCRAWRSSHPRHWAAQMKECRRDDPRHGFRGWRHTTHMHLTLNWPGARMQTSYWRERGG